MLNRSVALLSLTSQHMGTIRRSVPCRTCARSGSLCTSVVFLQTLGRAWRSALQHKDRKWKSVSRTSLARASKPHLSVELYTSLSARLCRAFVKNFGTCHRIPQLSCLPQPLCVLALQRVQRRIWPCCFNTSCRHVPPLLRMGIFHMGNQGLFCLLLQQAMTNRQRCKGNARIQRRRRRQALLAAIHRKEKLCLRQRLPILLRSNHPRLVMYCASSTGSATSARTRWRLGSGVTRSVLDAPLSMFFHSKATFSKSYLCMSPSKR